MAGFFLLKNVFTFAKNTRPAIFAGGGSVKSKAAAKSSGLSESGWYGTILDLSKEFRSIEYVKKLNLWEFFDLINREQVNNLYQIELSK